MTGITIYENHHTATIVLKERVDAFTASELRQQCDALFSRGVTKFVIDLSQTPAIDSAGIAVLVSLFKRSRQVGGYMKLTKVMSPAAQRILHLTRFDQIFETTEGQEVVASQKSFIPLLLLRLWDKTYLGNYSHARPMTA